MLTFDLSDAARIGSVIQFRYPRHNHSGVRSYTEIRRLRIDSVRDTQAEPVEAEFLEADPLLRRSRYLVAGWDLDKGAERCFYDGSMEEVEPVELIPTEESCIVVTINPDGIESLVSPVLPIGRARSLSEAWNERTPIHGKRAEAREVHLPAFTRDSHGKIK